MIQKTGKQSIRFDNVSHFIFDLDGCIYYGNTLYPGAKELLNRLREKGKKIAFLSNNSADSSEHIRLKLLDMGLPAAESSLIVVATESVAHYLKDRYGSLRVNAVGTNALSEALQYAGHAVYPLESDRTIDFMVLGRDATFDYEKLSLCVNKLRRGTKLIITNPDTHHIGHGGIIVPETGALAAAVQAAADLGVLETVGKPHPYPFQQILHRTGALPCECVMIGDNLETDIKGGIRAGMKTIWIAHAASPASDVQVLPDLTLTSIAELLSFLD